MIGKIYKSTGSWYLVRDDSGGFWNARLRGSYKIDGLTSSNPLAVGDMVDMEIEDNIQQTAIITEIHDRKNYIIRQSPGHKSQHNIIAANIDQSLLIATLKEPKTSQGFIDRFLVTSEAYHIPSTIVLNKSDLYREKEREKFEYWKDMYARVGYKIMLISVIKREGLDELLKILEGKTSLLSGHSGVGKSSLINAILPLQQLKTRDVSGWSGKGMHTTTFAEIHELPGRADLDHLAGL